MGLLAAGAYECVNSFLEIALTFIDLNKAVHKAIKAWDSLCSFPISPL